MIQIRRKKPSGYPSAPRPPLPAGAVHSWIRPGRDPSRAGSVHSGIRPQRDPSTAGSVHSGIRPRRNPSTAVSVHSGIRPQRYPSTAGSVHGGIRPPRDPSTAPEGPADPSGRAGSKVGGRRSGQRIPFSPRADNTLAAVPPLSGRDGRRGRRGRTGYPEGGGGGGPFFAERAVEAIGSAVPRSTGARPRPPVGVEYEKSLYPSPQMIPFSFRADNTLPRSASIRRRRTSRAGRPIGRGPRPVAGLLGAAAPIPLTAGAPDPSL